MEGRSPGKGGEKQHPWGIPVGRGFRAEALGAREMTELGEEGRLGLESGELRRSQAGLSPPPSSSPPGNAETHSLPPSFSPAAQVLFHDPTFTMGQVLQRQVPGSSSDLLFRCIQSMPANPEQAYNSCFSGGERSGVRLRAVQVPLGEQVVSLHPWPPSQDASPAPVLHLPATERAGRILFFFFGTESRLYFPGPCK